MQAEQLEPKLAGRALDQIGALYKIEEEIAAAGLAGEAKLEMRLERSWPVVERLLRWAQETLAERALLPSNPFRKAARYMLARRAGLQVFLGDPDVPIDTNHLERTLRPIPMGRKNWPPHAKMNWKVERSA